MSQNISNKTTILVAEDEDFMRERLLSQLAQVLPDANIVAVAENGSDAWDLWLEHEPDLVFLDIQMPGLSGLEVAKRIRGRSQIVFVTAYDQHAVQAFEHAAADYLLKPVEQARLALAVERVQQRLQLEAASQKAEDTDQALSDQSNTEAMRLLKALESLQVSNRPTPSKWLKATVGKQIRLIHLDDILFLQSDTKYTRVVTKDVEAYIRTPLKDLLSQLDPDIFWQIHRATIVNAHAIEAAERIDSERLQVSIKGCSEKLFVSRSFTYLFRESS